MMNKNEWKKVKLGDVCKIVSGSTPKTHVKEYWNGNINWLTPAEVKENEIIIYNTERKITEKAVKDTNLKLLPKGTVILSSRAPIGKIAIAGTEMYCNQGFKNLICSEKIYSLYLYYFLKKKKIFLNSLGRGATFKEISKTIVENIEITLPNYEEQIYISKIFNNLDNILKLKQQQLFEFEKLVKFQFLKMFGDPILNTLNFPTKKVIEVIKLQRGFDLPINQRNRKGNISVFGANGILGFHDEAKKNFGIITGRSGTLGEVYISEKPFWPLNTTLFSIDTYENNIIYLKYLLIFYDLKRFSSGTGVPTLNRNILHDKEIISVPIELQNKFADFVKQVDKSKVAFYNSPILEEVA